MYRLYSARQAMALFSTRAGSNLPTRLRPAHSIRLDAPGRRACVCVYDRLPQIGTLAEEPQAPSTDLEYLGADTMVCVWVGNEWWYSWRAGRFFSAGLVRIHAYMAAPKLYLLARSIEPRGPPAYQSAVRRGSLERRKGDGASTLAATLLMAAVVEGPRQIPNLIGTPQTLGLGPRVTTA